MALEQLLQVVERGKKGNVGFYTQPLPTLPYFKATENHIYKPYVDRREGPQDSRLT